jgi:FAD/FMN-containing dehydrogenase/Fe-S oxidoreductase
MIRSSRLVVADQRDLEHDLQVSVEGEVRFDAGSRAAYAHDASNYRQPPIGVVIPRHQRDVVNTLRVCHEHGAPVLGRGGGTSLAGQCVNHAIVIDFSKYVNRVLDVDEASRTVRVEPGCVLDDMRHELSKHGLTYGPDPSTHNHCTLGGMLGNNSCGVHSVMGELYGPGARTSDHVQSLEILTYDGLRLHVGATDDSELERLVHAGGRVGDIYGALLRLRDRYADEIRARFAQIPRRVSGYNIDELLPERGFHVARALVGTESTCVTILEATLAVYEARPKRTLCVLGYPDAYEAADHVMQIRAFRPVGLEGIDDKLLKDMQVSHLHEQDLSLLPEGRGWLLVEFGADSVEESEAQARHMMEELRRQPNPPAMKLFDDPAQAKRIWEVREAGLGATAFVPGHRDYWPGWEDSAVAPARLGGYLRELRALFQRHGLDAALYGHFGQGCVHCRIDFELASPDGIERYKRFTDEAADLCVRYGGSISGEHGDGQARGDLLEKQFGPDLITAFREFKRIWDPEGKMNPGKVVDGLGRDEHLKLATYHPPEIHTTFQPQDDHGDFRHSAIRCVGIGNCRRSSGGTMCPSYMVTHDEKHTTRGRARILFEMLEGEVIEDGWASNDVKDALDLCLACKGCKGDCPVHVDMATYKSEFLSHYYEHHVRPRHAYAMGWIHRWVRLGGRVPWLANFITQTPGLRRLAAWLGGLAPDRSIPRFARMPFTRSFERQKSDRFPVMLWPDTFNNYFFPETLHAAVEVLEDAGFQVLVPGGHLCCGRALYDYGMLDLAKKLWQRTLYVLEPALSRGVPIIGLEPSCVASFREELPNLFPHEPRAHKLANSMHTLAGFLRARDYQPPAVSGRALLHGHCHHKSVLDFDNERELLSAMSLDVDVPDSGCCGLAGSFGFEREHYDISMAIGERVLLPAVRATASDALLVADGFSCREQIRHGTGRTALHVAEVLAMALNAARYRDERDAATITQPRHSHVYVS